MSSQVQPNDGASGLLNLVAGASDYEDQYFLIGQMLARVRTTTLVQVISCTNDGGVSPVGLVDVKVLVQRMDGAGNVIDAGTVHNVPYFRVQGGTNAIIMDPQPGDIGLACISDRDISAIKASKTAAAPGSVRRHDMADALYIGGVLNGAPAQYIQFTDAGIKLVSPTKVTIEAPSGAFNINDMEITGATLKHNGVNIGSTHTHGGVLTGPAHTLTPDP
ncbi:oxidoreductase [Pseudomonas agarici]|uniref:Gp138 family membrane-puncturing spike protein n=1 Tax=Pseudomonas agarici TaxID=46677 RepID=UPI000378C712|nr:Gp138 family membrane-puncturing spike protein [Pseudomonas agarici]NWC11944.1 oxidoreductase [Pseudomonas agarici]SEL85755.1 hypothetical protein SAMN05216604_14031 [Pseudomonas agarici]